MSIGLPNQITSANAGGPTGLSRITKTQAQNEPFEPLSSSALIEHRAQGAADQIADGFIGFVGNAHRCQFPRAEEPLAFASAHDDPTRWRYVPFAVTSSIVRFVCMLGLWKMRRSAVIAYTALNIFIQIYLIDAGHFNPFGILWSCASIGICFIYFSRMIWP